MTVDPFGAIQTRCEWDSAVIPEQAVAFLQRELIGNGQAARCVEGLGVHPHIAIDFEPGPVRGIAVVFFSFLPPVRPRKTLEVTSIYCTGTDPAIEAGVLELLVPHAVEDLLQQLADVERPMHVNVVSPDLMQPDPTNGGFWIAQLEFLVGAAFFGATSAARRAGPG